MSEEGRDTNLCHEESCLWVFSKFRKKNIGRKVGLGFCVVFVFVDPDVVAHLTEQYDKFIREREIVRM